jgi:N-methylhydantoinase B
MWPSFTNVPNEYLEAYYPLRIDTYETVPNSGGAGATRGGNGIHTAFRFTQAGEVSIHDDRWFTKPWGVLGGEPGARGTKILERADGQCTVLPSKCDHVGVQPGDVLRFVTWGGGGWGNPLERDPELVLQDVRRGLVTAEGARAYGVVLAGDAVDTAGTSRLRGELAPRYAHPELFTRGGSIDELREKCLAETGLQAPIAPPASVTGGAPAVSAAASAPRPVRAERLTLEALVEQIARDVIHR